MANTDSSLEEHDLFGQASTVVSISIFGRSPARLVRAQTLTSPVDVNVESNVEPGLNYELVRRLCNFSTISLRCSASHPYILLIKSSVETTFLHNIGVTALELLGLGFGCVWKSYLKFMNLNWLAER